jgi:hypothetical protein
LAGFQVTFIGRFWVTAEAQSASKNLGLDEEQKLVAIHAGIKNWKRS